MSQFEFFQMLAGVVLAIGIAEVASGWGRQLRAGENIKSDWLHLGWTVAILGNAAIYWVGMWPYSESKFQYLGQIYFLIVPSVFYVLLCFAITPHLPERDDFSLRDYYLSKRKEIFLAYAAFMVMSYIADLLISGIGTLPELLPLGIIVGMYVSLAFTGNVRWHWACLIFTLGFLSLVAFLPLEDMYARFELS